tara:strand:- start:1046 stop:3229 length:2184 start_codon:yes stop_codon:yes gene_type:complete
MALSLEQKRAIAKAKAKSISAETTPVFADEAPAQAEDPSFLDPVVNAPGAIAEAFTGNERSAGAFQDAPEFVSMDKGQLTTPMEGTRDEKSKLMSGLLMSVDPQQKMDVIKAHVPNATFLQRSDGTVIVKVNGQNFWLDKPGVSGAGTVKSLVEMALYIPSMRAGALTSGFKRLITGGAAAAGTSAGLDVAAQDFGSEQGVNPIRTGVMFGAGVLGEALPMTVHALSKRAAVKHAGGHEVDLDAAPLAIKEAETLQAKVKDFFGVDFPLFRAQKTNSPTALAEQEAMLSNSLGVTASKEALREQNAAAATVVDTFIDELIPLSLNANLRVHQAAGKVIDLAKLTRKQQTSPLYTAATDNPSGGSVNIQSTLEILNQSKVGIPKDGKVHKVLTKVNGLLHTKVKIEPGAATPSSLSNLRRGGPHPTPKPKVEKLIPATDPKLLHNAKVEIDALLAAKGDKALDNHVASKLMAVQQELTKTLKAQVPGYEKAAAEYARLSIPVDELANSQIGVLANMKPATVDRVRAAIFAPGVSRETQNHTRSIIKNVDPEAWQMILREQLMDRVSSAAVPIGEASKSRILYRALGGGSDKKTNTFRNALSPKEKSSYDIVMSILEQGSKGTPPIVKPTVTPQNTGVSDAVSGQIVGRDVATQGVFTRLIVNPFKWLTNTDANVIKLAKVMFDPKWNSELRKIRKMGTGSQKSYQALLLLLAKVEDDRVNQSPPTETD